LILVTVGTPRQGFERLVKAMDLLASEINEQVVIQFGCSSYVPRYSKYFSFTTNAKMEQLIHEARIVVTHAAAGGIILPLKLRKPLVVVPRLKVHHEHFDDHQVQLAKALADYGKVILVMDPTPLSLWEAINRAKYINTGIVGPKYLVTAIHSQLEQWTYSR
jgi:beta-1,4-N-acetylglucosaminyltransferase